MGRLVMIKSKRAVDRDYESILDMDMPIAQAQFTENMKELVVAMKSLDLFYTRDLEIVLPIMVRLRMLLEDVGGS